MSKKDKLLKKFLKIPPLKDLTFNELETLLCSCGFIKIDGAGSAVKFYNKEKDILINLHKPHPTNILKVYLIKQIQIKIKEVCNG
ncbi:type II toxin-antitoxin system HicA family toxin [Sulfurimonas sp.]